MTSKARVPGITPVASLNFTCSLAKVRPTVHTGQVQTRFGCLRLSNRLTCVSFLKTILEIKPKSGEIVDVLTLGHL